MTLIPNRHHGCFAFVVFVLLICSSCTSTKVFPVVTPAKSHWNVELQFDPGLPAELQDGVSRVFNDFTIYSHTRPVVFDWSQDTLDTDMIVYVRGYRPVKSGQQVAGVIISLLGLSTPVLLASSQSQFIVTFWYFPKTRSVSEMSVRDDRGVQHKMHMVTGPGFLKTEESQMHKHASAYASYFRMMLRHYEKQLMHAKQKGLATTD